MHYARLTTPCSRCLTLTDHDPSPSPNPPPNKVREGAALIEGLLRKCDALHVHVARELREASTGRLLPPRLEHVQDLLLLVSCLTFDPRAAP